jgi:hypothetical protein
MGERAPAGRGGISTMPAARLEAARKSRRCIRIL